MTKKYQCANETCREARIELEDGASIMEWSLCLCFLCGARFEEVPEFVPPTNRRTIWERVGDEKASF